MKRKPREDFFTDLEFMSGFFTELDDLCHADKLTREREERYRAKRAVNAQKALRLYHRLTVVRNFDPWQKTAHIGPDVFDDHSERYDAVKTLYGKQARIAWILWAMYHYWMFDAAAPGTNPKFGKRYSKHRKLYRTHLETLQENVRQANWDRKRAKVRSRREKRKEKRNGKLTPEQTIVALKRQDTPRWDIPILDPREIRDLG